MNLDASFPTLWQHHNDLVFSEQQPQHCEFGEQFAVWAAELIERVIDNPSVILVNQSKVLLLDKYFEWRAVVPKAHRYHLGRGNSHVCIFGVFEATYERLKRLELSLTPPLLFLPQPPPPPAQIAGIFIGEEE
jgi:hypothetical protein